MATKTLTLDELNGKRDLTLDQLNKRDGGLQLRAEVRAIDQEARTVELAFSSEAEVERWFGIEVLDHSPGAMRTDRLRNGAALLVDHNWSDQVGVIESVTVDADRKGRALVRFGRSPRASEIFQDVSDRIRQHVSVAYIVHAYSVEERAGLPDLVRITDWEPYEISIVSVPADPTVGVGRTMENPQEEPPGDAGNTGITEEARAAQPEQDSIEGDTVKEKYLRDAKGNLVRAKVDDNDNIVEVLEVIEEAGAERSQGANAERTRVRTIVELGEQYGARELAAEFLKGDGTPEQFQRKLLDHMNGQRGTRPLGDQGSADVGMTDAEVRQFSFMRAIRALANPTDRGLREAAAFEFEASAAAAKRYGKEAQGIIVPDDVLRRALNTGTGGANPGDTGGNVIATDLLAQSFIDMLRNRNTIMRLGRTLAGLVGNIDIPKQTAGAAGYWLGEDEDATEDSLELGQLGLSPKTVAAYTEITRKLLQQSSIDIEALVRADLAAALATTIDLAGFYGTGTDDQPLGIANTAGINVVDFAAANPTYAEIVAMESAIAADNADVPSMAYVLNALMRGALKTTQKFAGTNGAPVWEPGNTVNGYRTEVTNQVANGDLVFGNFADLIIGMWGGLDMTVDPYSNSKKGRLRIVVFQDVDYAVRRVESFCLGRQIP